METLYQLWKYNNWANQGLFETFSNYGDAMPASCKRLLNHIMNTQSVWLTRLTGEKQAVGVWEEMPLDECKRLHEQASAGLKSVLDKNAGDLSVKIGYTNTAGNRYQNSIHEIVLHMLNHGTYHRGQIALEMRKNGLEPVITDYIVFVR
jgi:uncharacterized damage-inducible protein DinB